MYVYTEGCLEMCIVALLVIAKKMESSKILHIIYLLFLNL